MTLSHVFAETSFLFNVFRMPSKRRGDALALQGRFEAKELKLYVPYLCFQEARHLIAKTLPSHRCSDLSEFHRFADLAGTANWRFEEVQKLFDAATGEVNRTKAVYQRELADFAVALGDGILHATREVFDFLEAMDLDDDTLRYNDKLILSTVLMKAKELHNAGEQRLSFVSLDKSDLEPTVYRPKLTRYYTETGLTFVPKFVLPDTPAIST
jgi:predicted nucleic acid-binding protein